MSFQATFHEKDAIFSALSVPGKVSDRGFVGGIMFVLRMDRFGASSSWNRFGVGPLLHVVCMNGVAVLPAVGGQRYVCRNKPIAIVSHTHNVSLSKCKNQAYMLKIIISVYNPMPFQRAGGFPFNLPERLNALLLTLNCI